MHDEHKIFTSFSHDAMAVRQLLCYADEADGALVSGMSSGTHRQRMLDLFVSYRVLDLLAQVKGIAGLPAVPNHLKAGNLGYMNKLVCFAIALRWVILTCFQRVENT